MSKLEVVADKNVIFYGGDEIGDLADFIANESVERALELFFVDEEEYMDHYPEDSDKMTVYKVSVVVEKVVE